MTSTSVVNSRVPWRSSTVQILLLATFLAPLGVPLVSPALPTIRDAFGVSDAAASLLVSAYFLTGIVLSPFVGALADRVGRRRVLAGSLLVFGVTGGATLLAPSFGVVLALRVVQGTAAAGVFVSTIALVGDTFEGVQRNAVLGVTFAALSAGAALFPVVGGYLVGFGWATPFAAYLVAVPVALVAWVGLDEPDYERRSLPGADYLRSAGRAVTARGTRALFGATFATEFLLFGAVFTATPFLLAREAVAPVVIGGVILVAEATAIVVSAANGRLARQLSNRALVACGFGCFAAGFAGLFAASTPVPVGVAMIAVGAGTGAILPSVDAGVTDAVSGAVRAGAVSLRNSTTFLGRATGPVVFAGVATAVGYRPLLLAAAVASGLAGLALVLTTGSRGPRESSDAIDGAVTD